MPKLTKAEFNTRLKDIAESLITEVKPFESDTPEKKKDRKARCENDVFLFAETYLPHYCEDEFGEFHEEWDEIGNIENEIVNLAAPRGHTKTTFFSLIKELHQIVYKKRWLIINGADTHNQAGYNTTFVKVELEDNERIRHDFGDLKGKLWASDEFKTRTGVMVVSRGKGESLRGLKNGPHRPDQFYGDDIENDEEQKNPRRVEKTVRWIKRVVVPAMNPKGFGLLLAGTILSKKSAMAILMNEKDEDTGAPLHRNFLYRAIKDDGTPLWPERFTLEFLLGIKKIIGSGSFNAEYQNDPKDEEGMFLEEWLEEWPDFYHTQDNVTDIVICTDPSAKHEAQHDLKATIALGKVGKYTDVLRARIKRESVNAMISGVFDMYELLKEQFPKARYVVAFESNGFQIILRDSYEAEEEVRGYRLPLKLVDNYAPKMARIEALSSPVERGFLRIKKNNTDQNILIEQLLYLESPSVKIDGPDAMAGAYALINKKKSSAPGYESVESRTSSRLRSIAGSAAALLRKVA